MSYRELSLTPTPFPYVFNPNSSIDKLRQFGNRALREMTELVERTVGSARLNSALYTRDRQPLIEVLTDLRTAFDTESLQECVSALDKVRWTATQSKRFKHLRSSYQHVLRERLTVETYSSRRVDLIVDALKALESLKPEDCVIQRSNPRHQAARAKRTSGAVGRSLKAKEARQRSKGKSKK